MKTLTFRDFAFSARHCLAGRSHEAGTVHEHSYVVRFWYDTAPDQDRLKINLKKQFWRMNGVRLDQFMEDSSDEGLAAYFLDQTSRKGCVRVRVTTDGNRGAEVS